MIGSGPIPGAPWDGALRLIDLSRSPSRRSAESNACVGGDEMPAEIVNRMERGLPPGTASQNENAMRAIDRARFGRGTAFER
jgi:hypothetical protein